MKRKYDKKQSEKIWSSFYSRNDPQTRLIRFFDTHYFSHVFRMSMNEVLPKKGSIMETGCGEGMMSARLAKAGYDITLLDISQQALDAARLNVSKIAPNEKVKYVRGDIFKLPFKNDAFDIVWNQGVLEHFTEPEKAMREMYRTTKKSGHVVILVPYVLSPLHLYDILLRKLKLQKFWPFEEQIFYSVKTLSKQLHNSTGEKAMVKVIPLSFGFSVMGFVRKTKS